MSDKPDEDKQISLDNFVPPSKESEITTNEANFFMKQRQKQHKKYLKTALSTQQKIEKISQNEALIEAAKNKPNDRSC